VVRRSKPLDSGSFPLEQVKLNFLDIIFGVIIGISFADFKDLMVPLSFSFETLTLLLVYVIVFGHWIGYHYGLVKIVTAGHKPIAIPSNVVLGLISLYLYFYLLESVKDFSTVVIMMPVISGFDIISGSILFFIRGKYIEVERQFIYREFARVTIISLIFLVIFIIQAIVYNSLVGHFQSPILGGAPLFDWFILITSFPIYLVSFFFRYSSAQKSGLL
jgi:hypothetical protein